MASGCRAWRISWSIALLTIGSCQSSRNHSTAGLTGDPGQETCGFELEPPGLNEDPCAGGVEVVPTTTHVRTAGPPNVFWHSFATQRGTVCVQILNAGGRDDAVRAATVALDGQDILGRSSFGPGREAARRRIAIDSGEHTLRLELAGGVETELSVSVRFAPVLVAEDSDFGLMNLRARPASFSPDGNGIFDTTELLAVVDSDTELPGNAGMGMTFRLESAAFELADGETCQPVRTIELASVLVIPGEPVEVSTTWDGENDSGEVVGAGRYYFRIRGTLVRAAGNKTVVVGAAESAVAFVDVIEDAPAGSQDEGVTVGIEPGPQEVPYVPPERPSLRERAVEHLEQLAPDIELAFRGRMLSSSVQMRPVVYTAGSGQAPFLVAEVEVLDSWKGEVTGGQVKTLVTPLTASAPRFANGSEYAVFAASITSDELVAVGANAGVLPFVTPSQVELLRERFTESALRTLTDTEGTP